MRITIRIVTRTPGHTYLSMWVNGALCVNPGGICLRNNEVDEFLEKIQPDNLDKPSEQGEPPIRIRI